MSAFTTEMERFVRKIEYLHRYRDEYTPETATEINDLILDVKNAILSPDNKQDELSKRNSMAKLVEVSKKSYKLDQLVCDNYELLIEEARLLNSLKVAENQRRKEEKTHMEEQRKKRENEIGKRRENSTRRDLYSERRPRISQILESKIDNARRCERNQTEKVEYSEDLELTEGCTRRERRKSKSLTRMMTSVVKKVRRSLSRSRKVNTFEMTD